MNYDMTFRVGSEVWAPDFGARTIVRGILEWTNTIHYTVRPLDNPDHLVGGTHYNMVDTHKMGEAGHTKFTYHRGRVEAI